MTSVQQRCHAEKLLVTSGRAMRALGLSSLSAVLLLTLASPSFGSDRCENLADHFDCLPDKGPEEISMDQCLTRGCCWQSKVNELEETRHGCYHAPAPSSSYLVQSVCSVPTGGLEASLVRTPGAPPSGFPHDVTELDIKVQPLGRDVLRVKISDTSQSHFEPPLPVLNLDLDSGQLQQDGAAYDVSIRTDPASFLVRRRSSGEVLFDTGVSALIFSRQFLEVSARLPSDHLWGLGEHHDTFDKGSRQATYTIFNRGDLVPRQEGSGKNLYGSHPFYLSVEKSGKAHGVFLLNAHAMDVRVQPSVPALTYRTIGGVLDFFFFLGPSPDAVVQQYTALVGRPFLPPYWALGFHLSRYGYNTTQETRDTWHRNAQLHIPLDTMWSDIDYMDHMKDFTFDPERMRGIGELVQDLHHEGLHYVMNNSPGLSGEEAEGSYPPLDEARDLDILIRDYKGDLLKATVWQNVTYLLDFSNPKTGPYWEENLRRFHQQVPFDGSWIDMNEPYSFVPGSSEGCPADNALDHPPYVPGGGLLYNGTICLSAQQHLSTHYDLHNLYATMETMATHRALLSILGRRPFVLVRASSPGLGPFGTHWSGDVHSSWEHLRYSVTNMLEFNMFGIPMVGTDVCGFVGDTEEELCVRWTQLGAFYPFSRNHNDFNTIPQDPASFSQPVQDMMRDVLKVRYQLLPYLYTLLYRGHLLGTPVVRPLFFDFPGDVETYANDRQFLWGESLMVVPVLEKNAREVSAYLPPAVWYDYYTGQALEGKGQNVTLAAPLGHINLLMKEGSVIPTQEPNSSCTTTLSRTQPFQLLVNLDREGSARGDLYWDDGDSVDSYSGGKYNVIQIQVENNQLRISAPERGYPTEMRLSWVKIHGVKEEATSVQFNNSSLHFLQTPNVLHIETPSVSLLEDNLLTWA